MIPSKKAIDIKGLTAGYDGQAAIDNVDLEVDEGEFFGLIGPNGGGKSTLLKCMLGLIEPMKGKVKVFGMEPRDGRKHIGYVPQHSTFDREFPITVQNVVMMGRRRMKGMRPWYSAADREAVKKALTDVGMLDLRGRHISQLSGGQKQRVFIARALATEPKLMLLDEPTTSVDARMEESIYRLLRELNREVTVVLVTHDVGVISSYVDTIACINRKLFKNDEPVITPDMLELAYQCPVDLIAHGLPHRVLAPHEHGERED